VLMTGITYRYWISYWQNNQTGDIEAVKIAR